MKQTLTVTPAPPSLNAALLVQQLANVPGRDVRIIANRVYGCNQANVSPDSGSLLLCNFDGLICRDNIVDGGASHGIHVVSCQGIRVGGNTIRGALQHAMSLESSAGDVWGNDITGNNAARIGIECVLGNYHVWRNTVGGALRAGIRANTSTFPGTNPPITGKVVAEQNDVSGVLSPGLAYEYFYQQECVRAGCIIRP